MPKRTVPGAGKRKTINMRTTPDLRKKIERACGKSGRSISAEIEHRVERTFMQDEDRRHG